MSSQRPRMFYGWLVVGSTLLAMALSSGTDRSFGIVVIPLSEPFGWSRATLSTKDFPRQCVEVEKRFWPG
jgi:hypothetical protein